MVAPPAVPPATRQTMRRAGAAVIVGVAALSAVVCALAVAAATGATSPWLIVDPGPVVRWGIIAVRTVTDLSAALTVGLLALAAVALPGPQPGTAHRPALAAASGAATVWAAASLALLILTYADVSGLPLGDAQFGGEVVSFTLDVDLGRGLALMSVLAAVIGLVAAGAATMRAAGLLCLLSVVALVPQALGAHVAGTADHETAVTAMGLHLVGVCVWAGGLAALVLLTPDLRPAVASAATRRYSTLAGWSFAAVALSGVITAWLRLGGLDRLGTAYGAVVAVKVALLVALGVAGAVHRRRSLADLDAGRPRMFARLVAVELALMGLATGLGGALARTSPPAGENAQRPVSRAEQVMGYPLPPEPSASHWLTQWQPDLLWLLIAGAGAGCYLAGVARMRSRGDRWPVGHTVAWLLGLAVLVYVTSGPPAVYGRVLFSGHMVAHMMMSMIVPALLVLGAPVTLALRTLKSRGDGSRGPREWLLAVIGSPVLRVLSFAPVAAVLFAGSLVAFYYTDLFELALTTHTGHELMFVHFLLVGYLFAWVIVGVDPGPHRPGHPLRLLVLFATMAFHAFFGVALVGGATVLQPGYFGDLGREWGRSLLDDQRLGGSLAWGVGEIPTVLLAVVLAVQWSRSDEREARRRDRAADRDGDAELNAYNEMLTGLAERDRR